MQGQVNSTDRELLIKHKGILPKEKNTDEGKKQKNNATFFKYATQTSSPQRSMRQKSPIVISGLYDLNVKKLEEEIRKLKPVVIKENPCFKSPSRENLFEMEQRLKVAPPPTKYRPVDPRIDTSVIVKID